MRWNKTILRVEDVFQNQMLADGFRQNIPQKAYRIFPVRHHPLENLIVWSLNPRHESIILPTPRPMIKGNGRESRTSRLPSNYRKQPGAEIGKITGAPAYSSQALESPVRGGRCRLRKKPISAPLLRLLSAGPGKKAQDFNSIRNTDIVIILMPCHVPVLLLQIIQLNQTR